MPNAAENAEKRRIVCYVTPGRSLGAATRRQDVLAKVRASIAAGADWVEIREKDLPGRELLELTRGAISAAARAGIGQVRVIVNDRLDVALAAGAAGVHLGRESLAAGDVVRWCRSGNAPADFLVGVSCHALEEVEQAEAAGASYVFFGPVFDTPSKKSFGPPQGIAKLERSCQAVRIPVIAIGGVNGGNAEQCFGAGAAGIAAIRLFEEAHQAPELKDVIARLHEVG